MRFGKTFILLTFICILLSACNGGSNNTPLSAKMGFYEIEPINFSFQQTGLPTLSYKSSRARIMYAFYPADVNPETKPLFVFFNGGPGCATCTGLFSLNTAPHTLDKTRTEGSYYKANPYSFTQLGNLLYLDAPITGFSYNLVKNASDVNVRTAEFDAQNFNPFIDASQMIRVLLRFLADNPSIKRNNVIIVGESYGGVRASIMLNMLLFHNRYQDGTRVYRDASLTDEIQRHFACVNFECSGGAISP
jgi:carboxypeptidase C (cathepsin A)